VANPPPSFDVGQEETELELERVKVLVWLWDAESDEM